MGAIDPNGVASFGPKEHGWQDLCKQPLEKDIACLVIPSECQTVWIQIRGDKKPDILSGHIWEQTVCMSYQQKTLVGKELNHTI